MALADTIPTRVPDLLREMAREALDLAASPYNLMDDNPKIAELWAIVSTELHGCAARLEKHFLADLLDPGTAE
jgi:hypothetical protein